MVAGDSSTAAALVAPPRKQMQWDEHAQVKKKGVQHDEVDVTDDQEAAAVEQRRRPRARAPPMSAHGAHYSARVQRPMSPGKAQRLAAQTARREAENRTRRENERAIKERARKAAMRAGQRRTEEEAREKERRKAAREALWAQQEFAEQRDRVAHDLAAKVAIPSLGALSMPPTEKQIRRQHSRNRPEWGDGHAGGARMRMRGSANPSASHLVHPRQLLEQGLEHEHQQHQQADGGFAAASGGGDGTLRAGAPPAASPSGGAGTFSPTSSTISSSSPLPPPLSPPLGGLGLTQFKLALPQKEEPKGFTQWQEWNPGTRAPKPKAVRDVPRRTGVQPGPRREGAEPIEAWRTPEAAETLPVALPATSAPWLGWFVNAAAGGSEGESGGGGGGGAQGQVDGGWLQQVESADARELTRLLEGCATTDEAQAMACLTAGRSMLINHKRVHVFEGKLFHAKPSTVPHDSPLCPSKPPPPSFTTGPHVELTDAGYTTHLVAAMGAFPLHEALQFTGCELLGLLSNTYYGLAQKVFDAGAVTACLAACESFLAERLLAEEVLGAAFQAVHNLCVAENDVDKEGCKRKQAAVEAGALELIHRGMNLSRERWIMQAGKLAIGCLCKGTDPHGQVRRKRAHALFRLMT